MEDKHWYSRQYRKNNNIKRNKYSTEYKKLEPSSHLPESIEREIDDVWSYLKEPKHIKFLKILVILCVILIFGYIIFQNFLVSQEFYYLYEIGGEEDQKNPYLSPFERISETIGNEKTKFRELKAGPTYFIVDIPSEGVNFEIKMKFKGYFPEGSEFLIGARNSKEWNYTLKNLIIDEKKCNREFEWSICSVDFKLENKYVVNNKISMLINPTHLRNDQYANNTVSIDWIKITVYKPGLFERYNIKSWKDIPNIWRD